MNTVTVHYEYSMPMSMGITTAHDISVQSPYSIEPVECNVGTMSEQ